MNLQIAEGQVPDALVIFNAKTCFVFRDPAVPELLGVAVPNGKTKRFTLLVYVAKEGSPDAASLISAEDVETTPVALAMVEGAYNYYLKSADKGAVIATALSKLLAILKDRLL